MGPSRRADRAGRRQNCPGGGGVDGPQPPPGGKRSDRGNRPVPVRPTLTARCALYSSCKHLQTGRGSAWLERLVRDQEVGGSNPLAPTTLFLIIYKSIQFLGASLETKVEATGFKIASIW